MDTFHTPSPVKGDVQVFTANSPGAAERGFVSWSKPRGCTMAQITVIGAGGKGGSGAVGSNSTAAGGGGGGSAGKTVLLIPLIALPDQLFVSVGHGGTAFANPTFVSLTPDTVALSTVAFANGGGLGGNGVGATAGAAGAAAAAATLANMVLAGLGVFQALAGQAGIIGGVASAGGALSLPTTGITCTGGAGGGGLPATATTGTAGGHINASGIYPRVNAGGTQSNASNPGNPGSHGMAYAFRGVPFSQGGAGGGSSHGSATGSGLFGGRGGNGATGSGGGGGGGCLTGGVAGAGGDGGHGECTIVCW